MNQNNLYTIIFPDGEKEALKWLKKNGFSFGPASRLYPRGIMQGEYQIKPMKEMTAEDRSILDGHILLNNGMAHIIFRANVLTPKLYKKAQSSKNIKIQMV